MIPQPSLFAAGELDHAPVVGDTLDRLLTPQPLADACVRRVLAEHPELRRLDPYVRCALEPSAGGGAFIRAMRGEIDDLFVVGLDIDPHARGLSLADVGLTVDTEEWCEGQHDATRLSLVVGNPPFGKALEHVAALHRLQPRVMALILPLDRLGRQGWRGPLYDPGHGMRLVSVAPILPRPWGEHVRETALYTWVFDPAATMERHMADPIVWKGA